MATFSELVKNFNKIRDYMRDFYIYGFKSRADFSRKSLRTYDNEKRRIEGYLGEYMKWSYAKGGKKIFISLDSSKISQNPLYAAWKSKSFTSNDIELHFYLLDVLSKGQRLPVSALTEIISRKSAKTFDVQTIRLKCIEYAHEGILVSEKSGNTLLYSVSTCYFSALSNAFPRLLDSIKFFQETAPFGEVGNYILDNEDEKNDAFSFKHHYIVHTLEDLVLFDILQSIRKNCGIQFENYSERTQATTFYEGIPLKIFVSVITGRRYVCIYTAKRSRFTCFRLDYVKAVKCLALCTDAESLRDQLERNLGKVWGVGFGRISRNEILSMKLSIDEERDSYMIERINREGRGGKLEKLDTNLFLYTKECFDASEMAPWIKTFIGRIVALECSNHKIVDRFYEDVKQMYNMYCEEG